MRVVCKPCAATSAFRHMGVQASRSATRCIRVKRCRSVRRDVCEERKTLFATAEGETPVQVFTGPICIRITRSQTSGHLAQCVLLQPANTLRRLSDGSGGNECAAAVSLRCAASVHARVPSFWLPRFAFFFFFGRPVLK